MASMQTAPGFAGEPVAVDSLGNWARAVPDRVALDIVGEGTLTYAELDERSSRLATALRERGLRAGDHVAFLLRTGRTLVEVAWAFQRSGLIYTGISSRLATDAVEFIVRDCGARAVVAEHDLLGPLAGEVTERFPDLASRICVGGPTPAGWEAYDNVLDSGTTVADPDWCEGTDMLYSSGTTGRPKGVYRPFDGRPSGTPDSATTLAVQWYGLDNESVFLDTGPLYHAAPLRYTLAQHRLGNPAIVLPSFDAERFLDTVERYRITHTLVVPTMMVRFLRLDPEIRARYDLGSLRSVWHGAAPCPRDVKQAMIDWLGPILIENYGGTEGNGVTVVDSPTWLARPGTVGRPVRGTVHILDEHGHELPTGAVGTVYFAGGLPFAYHNDPDKTASAFTAEGWSTMGDMGWVDDEGYLYLSDRRTHLIISGGVNIYPRESEDVLSLHPAVEDVVVVGVPDAEFGEQVKAVVQLRDGYAADSETATQLIEFCRSRLNHVSCPRTVDFVESLPREPTGKIASRLVKAGYWPEGTL